MVENCDNRRPLFRPVAQVGFLALLVALALWNAPQGAQAAAPGGCDYDGNGHDDLAIGVPGEDVGAIENAGAVNVLYGGLGRGPWGRLTATGNQIWHQNVLGVEGVAEAGDRFGRAVACGDFNDDPYDDLAVGVPEEDVGTIANAGAVNVLYGSASGLTTAGNQIWHQDVSGVEGVAEAGDVFGWSLTSGDFNNDGIDDLAVGVPGESIGADFVKASAGAVNVIYGSASGLYVRGDQILHQDVPGIEDEAEGGDQLGWSLTSGDYDNDGFDDLAIGVHMEDVDTIVDAGAVNVVYGSALGLTASGNQFWHQNVSGVEGGAEIFDGFGRSLTNGDYNNDGFSDLAIGVPEEDVEAIANAGAVNVLYGSASGLTASGNQIWHQDVAGVRGVAEAGDIFGRSLTSGDYDSDGFDDLAVGASGEDIKSIAGAGAVNVLYGSALGLTADGDQIWHQDQTGVKGKAEVSDRFGWSVSSGDYDGNGFDDLAAGVVGESVGPKSDAGAVNVLYGSLARRGSVSGLSKSGNQIWHQDQPGIEDEAEAGDDFGLSVGE